MPAKKGAAIKGTNHLNDNKDRAKVLGVGLVEGLDAGRSTGATRPPSCRARLAELSLPDGVGMGLSVRVMAFCCGGEDNNKVTLSKPTFSMVTLSPCLHSSFKPEDLVNP